MNAMKPIYIDVKAVSEIQKYIDAYILLFGKEPKVSLWGGCWHNYKVDKWCPDGDQGRQEGVSEIINLSYGRKFISGYYPPCSQIVKVYIKRNHASPSHQQSVSQICLQEK